MKDVSEVLVGNEECERSHAVFKVQECEPEFLEIAAAEQTNSQSDPTTISRVRSLVLFAGLKCGVTKYEWGKGEGIVNARVD